MAIRIALWVAGLLVGVYSIRLAFQSPAFTFAGDAAGAAAVLFAGLAATTVGLVHWATRRDSPVGPLLMVAGVAWFLGEWDNPGTDSSAVFTVGLLLYAAAPSVVAHVTLSYPTGHLKSRLSRVVVAGGYLATIGFAGLLPASVLDPSTLGCSGCAESLLLVADRPDALSVLNHVAFFLGFAWSTLAVLAAWRRFAEATAAMRRLIRWVLTAGTVNLLAVAVSQAMSLERGFVGSTDADRVLWFVQAGSLIGLGLAVGWGLVRGRVARRGLARLVVDLDRTSRPGRLREALAELVSDPDLVLAYPLDAGRLVDERGRPVAEPADGRVMTTIRDAEGGIVVLIHRPGLVEHPLSGELTEAARLGIVNERLRVTALVQMADLRASRARILEAGDNERHRLERDLHDGAQQRLVALSLAMGLLRSRHGDDCPALRDAEGELHQAIAELRTMAHGLFPVVLRDEGLAAALRALGEVVRLRVTAVPAERLPRSVEITAYQVVTRAATAGPASVTAERIGDEFVLQIQAQGALDGLEDLRDRISALDGELEVTRSPGDCLHLLLRLPLIAPESSEQANVEHGPGRNGAP